MLLLVVLASSPLWSAYRVVRQSRREELPRWILAIYGVLCAFGAAATVHLLWCMFSLVKCCHAQEIGCGAISFFLIRPVGVMLFGMLPIYLIYAAASYAHRRQRRQ